MTGSRSAHETIVEGTAKADLDRLMEELRPKLHRYCARMTGSVIDGEDVVQEALVKAIEAFSNGRSIASPQAWLFRIAHNTALDFLRRRTRLDAIRSDEDPEMIADPAARQDDRQIAAAGLRTFMRLPVAQRGSVILMDVLGYSLEEISGIMQTSIPAVKATLHRGRIRLREIADEPDEPPLPLLPAPERALLSAYTERFNARDFDAIREMLAEEVRVDLVARTSMRRRREATTYFQNYASVHDWHFVLGFVDGRPAILVCDPSGKPTYFVLITWEDDKVAVIRDFRHARYVIEGADIVLVPAG